MSILIFANGELGPTEWVQPYLEQATIVIAVDGGADHLLSLGRTPDVVIGDLDSISPSLQGQLQAAGVTFDIHAQEKDATDLELALRFAAEAPEDEILILGALGGRLDQSLANVFLLTESFLRGRKVRIIEEHQQAWIIDSGKDVIKGSIDDLVSLLPLSGDVIVERTSGLQWRLQDEILVFGESRGISNVMTSDKAVVEVSKGTLLCIHTEKAWQR